MPKIAKGNNLKNVEYFYLKKNHQIKALTIFHQLTRFEDPSYIYVHLNKVISERFSISFF